ncbi:uroporphyrin-III C-methyltransferase [Thoreauomyces humboldtii]|nr:uroporphyrin-III C-methyltransferase [Thoreauomyces humboldtii]
MAVPVPDFAPVVHHLSTHETKVHLKKKPQQQQQQQQQHRPETPLTLIQSFLLLILSHLPFLLAHRIRLLLSRLPPSCRLPTGTCTLVGAGPGDPQLLTLAAHAAILSADVVISDLLVPPPILSLIRGRHLPLPRRVARSDDAQAVANAWMTLHVGMGLKVVRLKGGDPFVFGRGGEEVVHLRGNGVTDVTVVPGLSSCLAAAVVAGIPLTHRGLADQFLVVTGRGQGGRVPHIPPFEPRRTLVIMMGMARVGMLRAALVDEAGYPRHTPVAVVERATWPDQRVVTGTLDGLEKLVQDEGIGNPAVVYVGNVVMALRGGIVDHGYPLDMGNPADEGVCEI